MLRAFRLLAALLCAALLAHSAAARVLDDFTLGPFVAASDPDSAEEARSEQAGLSESHVVGGVRLVAVGRGGLGRAGVALAPDEIEGVVLTGAPSAYFDFYYDGLAGGDAASGKFGALGLDLSGASEIRFTVADFEAPGAQLTLSLWDSSRLDSQEIALVEGTTRSRFPSAPATCRTSASSSSRSG